MQDFSIETITGQLDSLWRAAQAGELGASLSIAQVAQTVSLIAIWVLGYKVTATAGRWTWESVRGPLALLTLVAKIVGRVTGTVGGGLFRTPGLVLRLGAWLLRPRPMSELANAVLIAVRTANAWQDDKVGGVLHAHKVTTNLSPHPFRVLVDGLDATASLSRREQRAIRREAAKRLKVVIARDDARMRREMLRTLLEPAKQLDGGLRRGQPTVVWGPQTGSTGSVGAPGPIGAAGPGIRSRLSSSPG